MSKKELERRKKLSKTCSDIKREAYFSAFGDKCMICERQLNKRNWCRHHTDYEQNLIVLLCRGCHAWVHGKRAYSKAFYEEYGKDKAPLIFAKAVVKVYKKAKPDLKIRKVAGAACAHCAKATKR